MTIAAAALLLVVQLMIRVEALRPAPAIVQLAPGGDGIKSMSPDNAYVVAVVTGVLVSAMATAYAALLLTRRNPFIRALTD